MEKAHPDCSLSLGLLWHGHWLFITQGRGLGREEYCSPLCKLVISQSWCPMRQAVGSRWGRSTPCPERKPCSSARPLNSLSLLTFHQAHTLPQVQTLRQWPGSPGTNFHVFGSHMHFCFSLSRIWGQLTSHISVIANSTLYSRLVMEAEELASLLLSTSRSRSGAFPLLTLVPAFQRLRCAGLQRTSGSAIWGG